MPIIPGDEKSGSQFLQAANANRTWTQRWTRLADGGGGGQSDTKVVVDRTGVAGHFFLKILRSQNDPNRRRRMFREVAAYKTLNHDGVPKLIDSNADHYDDLAYKLYLVTEYVEGVTLETRVAAAPLSFEDAVHVVLAVLDVVAYCHATGVLHRDIKPDNVMFREGSLDNPVLVDFGLSFNESDEQPLATLPAEELGNRFLRLPEFSVGGENADRRSGVSDLTQCCGLLLYSLTGCIPGALQTGEAAQMPHQRDEIRAKIQLHVPSNRLLQLQRIFDRSFRGDMSHRWQSAAELREQLEGLIAPPVAESLSVQDKLKKIATQAETPHIRSANLLAQRRREVLHEVGRKAHAIVAANSGGLFTLLQSGGPTRYETRLAVTTFEGRDVEQWLHVFCTSEGEDLAVSMNHYDGSVRELARLLPADDVTNCSRLDEALLDVLVEEMHRKVLNADSEVNGHSLIEGLTASDFEILKLSGSRLMEHDEDSTDLNDVRDAAAFVSDSAAMESVDALEEKGFLNVSRYSGGSHWRVTPYGFEQYAKVCVPDYEKLILKVTNLVAQGNTGSNVELHSKLGISQPIVDHALALLEQRSLLELMRMDNGFVRIVRVSASLRRSANRS